MEGNTIWKVMMLTTYSEGTTTVKNGVRIYTPPKAYWCILKTDSNFEKLDAWLTRYIRANGYCYSDFKICRQG